MERQRFDAHARPGPAVRTYNVMLAENRSRRRRPHRSGLRGPVSCPYADAFRSLRVAGARRGQGPLPGDACSRRRSIAAALYALYAFNLEVARTRELVREPMPGEIRLQWWARGVLGGMGRGDIDAHRVAAASRNLVVRYRSAAEGADHADRCPLFRSLRRADGECGYLERYARETSPVLIELAARISARRPRSGDRRGSRNMPGIAYGRFRGFSGAADACVARAALSAGRS